DAPDACLFARPRPRFSPVAAVATALGVSEAAETAVGFSANASVWTLMPDSHDRSGPGALTPASATPASASAAAVTPAVTRTLLGRDRGRHRAKRACDHMRRNAPRRIG